MHFPTPAAKIVGTVASLPAIHPTACDIVIIAGGLLLLASAFAAREASPSRAVPAMPPSVPYLLATPAGNSRQPAAAGEL
jgi:hypothetical protein